ncbi:hypothetical protein RIF29_00759 [Crotalaria pallida]|uniref:Uncharacterized protein n=1 Tax=Crotalaria pallida TaxID=3830 RepID=A0AAN9P7N8_CROPI
MSTPISSVPKNLDLEQLDDDDFEDIDALSPKKAASILKKLDLLRSRIKGKVIEGDKEAVNEVIQNQCVEVSVVNETQMESGEVQILEEDHSRKEQQEGSWTPPMLRELNKRKFKDIDTKASQARTKLDTIQDLLQTDPSNIHLQKLEKEARMDHAEVYKAAIMFLKQKAKQEWLCESDLNTKFFHQIISIRRDKNRILRIQDSHGNVVSNQDQIGHAFEEYFQNLLSDGSRPWLINDEEIDQGKVLGMSYSIKDGYDYLIGDVPAFPFYRTV